MLYTVGVWPLLLAGHLVMGHIFFGTLPSASRKAGISSSALFTAVSLDPATEPGT